METDLGKETDRHTYTRTYIHTHRQTDKTDRYRHSNLISFICRNAIVENKLVAQRPLYGEEELLQ